jgi:N-acetylneuraminic acid mutarotase
MRIIINIALLSLLVLTSVAITKPTFENASEALTWYLLPPNLVNCTQTAGAYYNGLYYQVCGLNGLSPYSHMLIYNGSSWSVSSATHPGGGVYYHSAAVLNGKIIVSGGPSLQESHHDYTTVYDPSTSSWTNSTPMPAVEMSGTAMATYQGKCYLFGGIVGGTIVSGNSYRWTPDDSAMTKLTGMPAARCGMAVTEWNGKIYLFGGLDYAKNATWSIWEYNPIPDSWSVKPCQLIVPVASATAFTVGDEIYIIGGYPLSRTNVQVYDTVRGTITTSTSLPVSTGGHASAGYVTENGNASYTGHIYVSGGDLGLGAYLGIVGDYNYEVQPASLGSIKACYH